MSALSRRVGYAIVVTALLVALLPTASAGERVHVVAPGESVSSITKRYYGDFELVDLLLRYNGKGDARIHPGETLAIPVSAVHRVRSGDTWSQLAERYVGESSAYPVIAILNGLQPDAPLSVGATITMPSILEHRLARGETLVELAERYYGDADASPVLARFNAIDDPRRLSTGQTIRVPVTVFRVRDAAAERSESRRVAAATPQPASPKPRAPKKPDRRFADELGVVARAFDRGEFDLARRTLEAIRKDVARTGAPEDRTEFARWMAFVYVAFDRPAEACALFGPAGPPDGLDPDRVSPKIRAALAECAGSGPAS